MQRVDEDLRARQGQSLREKPGAKLRHQRGFVEAAQPGIADPGRKLGKLRVVHCRVLGACRGLAWDDCLVLTVKFA